MDLIGEAILHGFADRLPAEFAAEQICPPYHHRFARLPVVGRRGAATNADRLLNRSWDYPRTLSKIARRGDFDLYHIVDHSYSQLVHVLPPGRAVVTCHDLDTFRCLLEPDREPRPRWFRAMTRRILDGLRKASAVACDSEATRDALVRHGIQPADRAHVVHLGIHPDFSYHPDPSADADADALLGPSRPDDPPDLLHVGSNIPRKRVDVLLDVFANVRRSVPGTRLLKIGGALPPELQRRAVALGVADAIVTLPFLDRAVVAAVYRRASLVLQTSDAEGFGLPVAEALACGAPLLATDLPVLREVGGDAPIYRPVGDVPAWTKAALSLLEQRRTSLNTYQTRRAAGIDRARAFSWTTHVERLAEIHREVLSRAN